MARKIHAPIPWVLNMSGIPINIKALKRAAAKVSTPIVGPIFNPASMYSSSVLSFLYDFTEAITSARIKRLPNIITHVIMIRPPLFRGGYVWKTMSG